MTADTGRVATGTTDLSKIVFLLNQLAERIARGNLTDQDINGATALTSPATDDVVPIYDKSATTNKGITLANLFTLATAYKASSFTRDLSTASGNQSVTGVGFTPKAIIVIAGQSGVASVVSSIGFSGGGSGFNIVSANTGAAPGIINTSILISVGDSGGFQTATLSSFDADGFTLAWTKSSSPTATATMAYLALR